VLFFLMPIKFPYLIATMDAARVLDENTALVSGLFPGIMGCAASSFFSSGVGPRPRRSVPAGFITGHRATTAFTVVQSNLIR
jgi:hypothetical protein